jgi:hypothetical protein
MSNYPVCHSKGQFCSTMALAKSIECVLVTSVLGMVVAMGVCVRFVEINKRKKRRMDLVYACLAAQLSIK